MNKQRDHVGQILAGKYQIEALLGAGGFGKVYRGRHLVLSSPVAIKILRAELALEDSFRERFKREAVALSRLRHPGIAAVHDYGEEDGEPFIVMEYIEGRVLSRLLYEQPQMMPLGRVLHIIEEILAVLSAAHAAGIIHRDIKPDNLMLVQPGDRTERVKVLDFGLALLSEKEHAKRLTEGQLVQGTPEYLSPEQCVGETAGPESDVYAAGVVLFEMLTGVVPFSGATTTDIMLRHVYVDVPKLAQVGRRLSVPEDLERLVRWALTKKKDERPSAAQLRAAILRLRGDRDGPMEIPGWTPGRAEAQTEVGAAYEPVSKDQSNLPLVLLFEVPASQAAALRDGLAVNGLHAVDWDGRNGLPPPKIEGQPVQVIVLLANEGIEARVRAIKGEPPLSRIPLLVMDAPASDTPKLIRAGVSDVALHPATNAGVCRQIWRLIQRKR